MSFKKNLNDNPMWFTVGLVSLVMAIFGGISYVAELPNWVMNNRAWLLLGGSFVFLVTNFLVIKKANLTKGKLPHGSIALFIMSMAGIILAIWDLLGKSIPKELGIIGFIVLIVIAALTFWNMKTS